MIKGKSNFVAIRVKRCIRLRVSKERLEKGEHVQFLEKKRRTEREP